MKIGLNAEQAGEYAHSSGLLLDGFTVSPDHSIVLCEQGKEWFYSRKRPDQRKPIEQDYHSRVRRS